MLHKRDIPRAVFMKIGSIRLASGDIKGGYLSKIAVMWLDIGGYKSMLMFSELMNAIRAALIAAAHFVDASISNFKMNANNNHFCPYLYETHISEIFLKYSQQCYTDNRQIQKGSACLEQSYTK